MYLYMRTDLATDHIIQYVTIRMCIGSQLKGREGNFQCLYYVYLYASITSITSIFEQLGDCLDIVFTLKLKTSRSH